MTPTISVSALRFGLVSMAWSVAATGAPGAGCPVITQPPFSGSTCPFGVANFSVMAEGDEPLTYRWQIETAPGVWATMGNDPMPMPCAGGGGGAFAYASSPFSSQTPIGVHACPGVHEYSIRCVVTNACGSTASDPATLIICCAADVTTDGVVNVEDLLAVISAWGPCSGPPPPFCPADIAPLGGNGVVNVEDLLAVISAWGGCP